MIDLTGMKFGKLLAIARNGSRQNGPGTCPTWLCLCDCGNMKTISAPNLRSGVTQSCGCIQRRHGMFGTPEYSAWNSMMRRCLNKKQANYKNYGGRGITVCEKWKDFAVFFEDMGPRPSQAHSLDRINNMGNYEPSNCRWATWTQQARNKRNSRVLIVAGESATVPEWAEKTGLGRSTIKERLRRGWDPERAVTTPA